MASAPPTAPNADPWSIRPESFAGLNDPQARLRFLMGYAILAPSSHNTQPWLFRLHGTRLDLLADRRTVAEGAFTAPVLAEAAAQAGVDMPITDAVLKLRSASA
jgi:nitroreductase